jgi:myo-inositol-1(or 4)-monophosphatase
MPSTSPFLQAALKAAALAGKALKEGQDTPLDIQFKGSVDLVTRMDKESERIITGFLQEAFPEHGIVAEEGTSVSHDSGFVWYIDPLDGTTNYAHGLPWYAVSIGLFKDGRPLAGVVGNPANGEVFWGEAGRGAFLNGRPIRVSTRDRLEGSLLVTGFPYYVRDNFDRVITNLSRFLLASRGVRRFGAAALDMCYVAAGRYDGFWEEGLKPWDTAAALAILLEAGGRITDYAGGEYSIFGGTMLSSNGVLHDQMLQTLGEGGG